jgi:hypothetical protein
VLVHNEEVVPQPRNDEAEVELTHRLHHTKLGLVEQTAQLSSRRVCRLPHCSRELTAAAICSCRRCSLVVAAGAVSVALQGCGAATTAAAAVMHSKHRKGAWQPSRTRTRAQPQQPHLKGRRSELPDTSAAATRLLLLLGPQLLHACCHVCLQLLQGVVHDHWSARLLLRLCGAWWWLACATICCCCCSCWVARNHLMHQHWLIIISSSSSASCSVLSTVCSLTLPLLLLVWLSATAVTAWLLLLLLIPLLTCLLLLVVLLLAWHHIKAKRCLRCLCAISTSAPTLLLLPLLCLAAAQAPAITAGCCGGGWRSCLHATSQAKTSQRWRRPLRLLLLLVAAALVSPTTFCCLLLL